MTNRRTMLAGLSGLALATSAILSQTPVPPALAQAAGDPTQEIVALMEQWAATYGGSTTPDAIAALYAEDAVFWGTGSTEPYVGRASFAPYFQRQFDSFTTHQVSFHDQVIRIYGEGNFATNIGTYEFDVATAAGQRQRVRHRYSFAYIRTAEGWRIAQQHSSAMPR